MTSPRCQANSIKSVRNHDRKATKLITVSQKTVCPDAVTSTPECQNRSVQTRDEDDKLNGITYIAIPTNLNCHTGMRVAGISQTGSKAYLLHTNHSLMLS